MCPSPPAVEAADTIDPPPGLAPGLPYRPWQLRGTKTTQSRSGRATEASWPLGATPASPRPAGARAAIRPHRSSAVYRRLVAHRLSEAPQFE